MTLDTPILGLFFSILNLLNYATRGASGKEKVWKTEKSGKAVRTPHISAGTAPGSQSVRVLFVK